MIQRKKPIAAMAGVQLYKHLLKECPELFSKSGGDLNNVKRLDA